MLIDNKFDPTVYSLEECAFLIAHLGEPVHIALKDIHPVQNPNPPRDATGKVIDKNPIIYPDGVNPASVKPALQKVYELEETFKHSGDRWVGVEAVKACLRLYLEHAAQWERDAKRGAPRFPSMHTFDTKNRPHRGGPGSDSGKVSTYFDQAGVRKPLALFLYGDGEHAWTPDWAKTGVTGTDQPTHASGLRVDDHNNRIECLVCGHTEHFKSASRSSYNAARARIGKHLMKATDETERHREIHTAEFGT